MYIFKHQFLRHQPIKSVCGLVVKSIVANEIYLQHRWAPGSIPGERIRILLFCCFWGLWWSCGWGFFYRVFSSPTMKVMLKSISNLEGSGRLFWA
ncbi:hypothetical protein BDZ45DRAFT_319949 [Acephala macrosclerotiorum]|nr:hypothetical protein BDZ45DRAFT_319949 [Acephala macrosclerotiorum]